MMGFIYEPGVKVEGTCSFKFNNTMYILGGPPNAMASTQMLVLNQCILQRVGTLNYPMNGCLVLGVNLLRFIQDDTLQ